MSTLTYSNGARIGVGVGEESLAQADDFFAIASCIAAVNIIPLGVIINTLCLKEGRFDPELDLGAMVVQLVAQWHKGAYNAKNAMTIRSDRIMKTKEDQEHE